MWIILLIFFYLKADEVTKDPCSICAERMGEEVICTTGEYVPVKRVYYPNGTIYNDNPQVIKPSRYNEINLSKFIVED